MLTVLLTLVVGVAGAVFAHWLSIPIPWLIGSMIVCGIFTTSGVRLAAPPRKLELWMRVIIGVSLGPSVANSLSSNIAQLPFAIVSAVVLTTLLVILGTWWFEKRTQLTRPLAYIAAMPGGLSFLIAIASAFGDKRPLIALIHTVRVVSLIIIVSLLARYTGIHDQDSSLLNAFAMTLHWHWLLLAVLVVVSFTVAEVTRIAGGHVLVPMVLTTVFIMVTGIEPIMPEIAKTVAMLTFGIMLGCELGSGPRQHYMKLGVASVLYTLAALLIAAGMALLLQAFIDQPAMAIFLALAPGGIAEVSLIALALDLDAGMIALVHTCRFSFIMLLGPLGLRLLTNRPQ